MRWWQWWLLLLCRNLLLLLMKLLLSAHGLRMLESTAPRRDPLLDRLGWLLHVGACRKRLDKHGFQHGNALVV